MPLQQVIASLIDLRYQAKQAHWNYTGDDFYAYHLLFDRIYDDYEDFIDRLGERVAGMKEVAPGNIDLVVKESILSEQTTDSILYPKDLARKLMDLSEFNKKEMDLYLSMNDQASANILMEVQERIDQHLFLLK
jgi:starvation-inducible DNA-binding protein